MFILQPEGTTKSYSTAVFIVLSSSSAPVYKKTLSVSLPDQGTLVPDSQYLEITVIGR